MSKLTNNVRNHIAEVLKNVTGKNSPSVHLLVQTELGYKGIEERIIVMMQSDNISASACIPHIEKEI